MNVLLGERTRVVVGDHHVTDRLQAAYQCQDDCCSCVSRISNPTHTRHLLRGAYHMSSKRIPKPTSSGLI